MRYAVLVALMTAPIMGVTTEAANTAKTTVVEPVVYQSDLDTVLDAYPNQTKSTGEDTRYVHVVKRGTPTPIRTQENPNDLPVRIDADHMYMNDTSGDVWAEGAVDVYQGLKEIHTDRIEGNTKQQEYHTVGPYHYLEDSGRMRDLKGENLSYNAATGAMKMGRTKGYNDPYYISGTNATYDGQKGHIENGWATTKNAMAFIHTPDYRVEGDDIDIYHGDKAVIHNARFYIKNWKVASLKTYTVSLKHEKSKGLMSFMPRPTYNSDNGWGLKGSTDFPLGSGNDEIYLEYEWWTKAGFKPTVGIRHYFPWGVASFGIETDEGTLHDETVWVKKRPEFRVTTNTYHIGDTPFTVRGGASIGRWSEGDVSGKHWKYFGEVSHDPVHPFKNADLRLFVGYQRDYYGYNDFTRSMPYWGVNFNAALTNRLNVWAGYRQNNIGQDSPYEFDRVETHRKVTLGGSYKLTHLDRFSINTTRNVENGALEDVDYTWQHDFHSFWTWLTYSTKAGASNKDHKWKVMIQFKDFDF